MSETTLAFTSQEMGNMNLGGKYLKADINGKPFDIELASVTEAVPCLCKKPLHLG